MPMSGVLASCCGGEGEVSRHYYLCLTWVVAAKEVGQWAWSALILGDGSEAPSCVPV